MTYTRNMMEILFNTVFGLKRYYYIINNGNNVNLCNVLTNFVAMGRILQKLFKLISK